MNHILLVDDDERVLFSLRRLLGRMPCAYEGKNYPLQVEVCHDPLEAIEYVRQHDLDLVIADYRMPQIDGITFLKKCRDIQPNMSRMLLSGQADLEAMISAINEAQIYRFIAKPWDDHELVFSIGQCLAHHHHLRAESRKLAELQANLLGQQEGS
ncbi:Response regulator receiver domain-containing protein [Formivibrio citricus]|uniref:Response regulator receiver domain-containing protein n=1 Tax=Formivibrio citricus TaxID=83765 RepID=A0A1I4X730_9NEIS|nr:response regulator [Formivibrio citricus]SFN21515.1 Response regulator receiver domain-containing protein [Formivibrio citricus]